MNGPKTMTTMTLKWMYFDLLTSGIHYLRPNRYFKH